MHDKTYAKELKISSLANGYKDLLARIDLNTYRRTPIVRQGEESLPFFMITFMDMETGKSLSACPRGLLERVVEDLKFEGFHAFAGAEYEYFNFKGMFFF